MVRTSRLSSQLAQLVQRLCLQFVALWSYSLPLVTGWHLSVLGFHFVAQVLSIIQMTFPRFNWVFNTLFCLLFPLSIQINAHNKRSKTVIDIQKAYDISWAAKKTNGAIGVGMWCMWYHLLSNLLLNKSSFHNRFYW